MYGTSSMEKRRHTCWHLFCWSRWRWHHQRCIHNLDNCTPYCTRVMCGRGEFIYGTHGHTTDIVCQLHEDVIVKILGTSIASTCKLIKTIISDYALLNYETHISSHIYSKETKRKILRLSSWMINDIITSCLFLGGYLSIHLFRSNNPRYHTILAIVPGNPHFPS